MNMPDNSNDLSNRAQPGRFRQDIYLDPTPDGVQITYTKLELLETREDGIQILTQFELTREQEFQPGNKIEGYKPQAERRRVYLVKLHGLKERGYDLAELIERIQEREKRRQSKDNTILTLQSGLKVGLDEGCIRQFCADNDLDPDSTISRSELRKIVLKKRNMNAIQYGVGLRLLRIPIEVGRNAS